MKGADGGMYHDQYLFGSFYLVFINKAGMQLLRRVSTPSTENGVLATDTATGGNATWYHSTRSARHEEMNTIELYFLASRDFCEIYYNVTLLRENALNSLTQNSIFPCQVSNHWLRSLLWHIIITNQSPVNTRSLRGLVDWALGPPATPRVPSP